jgi:hypothetical protein
MKQSESCAELFAALSKAQGAMGAATKDGKNPHFKSAYATLASCIEAVRGPFAANGLAFVQAPTLEGDVVSVETMLVHSSGQWIASTASAKPAKLDPQAVGSAISYLKRYALMAMAALPSADDDGEAAVDRSIPPPTSYKTAPAALPPMPAVLINRPFKYSDHRDLVPNAAAAVGIPANKIIEVRENLTAFLEANASTHDLPQWIDAFFKKEGDK